MRLQIFDCELIRYTPQSILSANRNTKKIYWYTKRGFRKDIYLEIKTDVIVGDNFEKFFDADKKRFS